MYLKWAKFSILKHVKLPLYLYICLSAFFNKRPPSLASVYILYDSFSVDAKTHRYRLRDHHVSTNIFELITILLKPLLSIPTKSIQSHRLSPRPEGSRNAELLVLHQCTPSSIKTQLSNVRSQRINNLFVSSLMEILSRKSLECTV